MISSHQGKKGIKIFFPSITPVFSLWNKARLSTDLTRNCALSEVFHLLDSRSLIWTIAASGKKSLVRGYFKPSKTKLTRGPCSVIPHPPYPRPPQHLPAAGSDDLGRLWPGLPDTLEVYRRFLFPSGAFSVWNWGEWSPVSLSRITFDLETCSATSHMCFESRCCDLNWAQSSGWIIPAFL